MSSRKAPESTLPGEKQRHAHSTPEDPERLGNSKASSMTIPLDDKESKERDEQVRSDDGFQVVLEPEDDPKNLPVFRKWLILLVVCCGSLCATCASSMVRAILASFLHPAPKVKHV